MGCGGSKQTAVEGQSSPNKSNNINNNTKGSPNKNKGKDSPTKEKYVVNGSTNGDAQRSESVVSESTDKGFKRRVREKMRAAAGGNDIEELQKAIEKFENHHLDDCGDLTKARDRLEFLSLRRDLRDAVRRSHVGVLEKTISAAEKSRYTGQLAKQMEAAKRKLQHLKELNTYKHDILNMEQSTISEIHSYQRPPPCVHDVMAATYMLLGHPEPRLTDWSDIQALLCVVGRGSLIHEVTEFDSAHLDDQTTSRVQDILQPHELDSVRQASNGAAAFYVWCQKICDKVGRDKQEEEARLRAEELEKQNEAERQAKGSKTSPKKK